MNAATRAIIEPIIDHLGTAVIVVSKTLTVGYMNTAAENLLCTSSTQAQGVNLARLIPMHDELASRLANAAAYSVAHQELEYRWTSISDHQEHIVDLRATPLPDAVAGHDLAIEILPLDRHLRLNKEWQAQIQHDTSREVIRGLAHEVKNPLGGIRGAAQLLEAELPTAELREYTDIIIREADRLQSLVDRVLGPNRPPRKSDLNIHEVLENVHQLIAIEYPDLDIVCDYDPSLPDIHADAEQLVQATLNIARNAARAMDGIGRLTLRSRSARRTSIGGIPHRLAVAIEIVDNGPGIPEDLHERIFYPLVTGHADGTGLGLPIAQSLIHQHDGSIACDSEPGHTLFRVLLPVEQQRETE